MRVACLGGGPAGLYFAILMKLRDPAHEVIVVERNRSHDTFGWGVVLSDETLANLAAADPVSAEEIRRGFVYWDDIAVHYRGTVTRSSGHGFSGIGRKRLLNILQDRAQALGVELRFETEIDSLEPYRGYDLIVAADGINSKVRNSLAHVFKPDIDVRACKYIWLGTHAKFDDAFTFIFEETPARLDLGARLPVRPRHGDLHRRMLGSDLAARRLRPHGPGGNDRGLRDDLREEPRRQAPDDQRAASARLGLAQLQPRAVRDLVARERRADGRCRRNRAFLGRLRHQARAGKRHCARRIPPHRADHGGRLPPLRGRAAHRGAAAAERGAQLHRMVRGGRALSRSRSRAVQLLAADPLAAHQPREPAHPRQGVAAKAPRCGSSSRRPATGPTPRDRRCSPPSACATCT